MEFYDIAVRNIINETKDTVSIVFDIASNLKEKFIFKAGQYITIKVDIDGEELRRSYSISSSPADDFLRIAVKTVPHGRVSTFLNKKIKVGDVLSISNPDGKFIFKPNYDKNHKRRRASNFLITFVWKKK